MKTITLYHGTTSDCVESIFKGIKVEINRDNEHELDFGYGFYMSTKRWYARKLAKTKSKIAKSSVKPVLIKCLVDIDSSKENAGDDYLEFKIKSLNCIRTIFNARYALAETDTIHKKLVYAPIADGNVDTVMDTYKMITQNNNSAVVERIMRAISYFRYWLPVFSRQYVVKDASLCKYITLSVEEGGKLI